MSRSIWRRAACRVRANEFRAVNELLGELPMIEPSPAFDVRVHARVAAEPVKQNWWAWMWSSPRIAFAASMLLLVTLWVGYRSQRYVPPPSLRMKRMRDDAGISVMEDHDMLANFEPLKELPPPVEVTADSADDNDQQM